MPLDLDQGYQSSLDLDQCHGLGQVGLEIWIEITSLSTHCDSASDNGSLAEDNKFVPAARDSALPIAVIFILNPVAYIDLFYHNYVSD